MNREHLYLDYLEDLAEALAKSQEFIRGMSYEEFLEDEKTVYAVIRALEVVGEATKQIPIEVRDAYAEIPWRAMSGMRDKLIHHYFGVNLAVVWKTVTEDVEALLPHVRLVLRRERGGGR
jgi:uncharacterized protein with HEPN domain